MVKYETESAASYAINKINNFELNENDRIIVEPYAKSRSSSGDNMNNQEHIKNLIQLHNTAPADTTKSSKTGKQSVATPVPLLAPVSPAQTETEQSVQQNLGYLLLLTQLKNLSGSSGQTSQASTSQTKTNESSEVDNTVSSSNADNSSVSQHVVNPISATSSDAPENPPVSPALVCSLIFYSIK